MKSRFTEKRLGYDKAYAQWSVNRVKIQNGGVRFLDAAFSADSSSIRIDYRRSTRQSRFKWHDFKRKKSKEFSDQRYEVICWHLHCEFWQNIGPINFELSRLLNAFSYIFITHTSGTANVSSDWLPNLVLIQWKMPLEMKFDFALPTAKVEKCLCHSRRRSQCDVFGLQLLILLRNSHGMA